MVTSFGALFSPSLDSLVLMGALSCFLIKHALTFNVYIYFSRQRLTVALPGIELTV